MTCTGLTQCGEGSEVLVLWGKGASSLGVLSFCFVVLGFVRLCLSPVWALHTGIMRMLC